MRRFLLASLAALAALLAAANGEFEEFSNDEIEDLLKTIDYMEEMKRDDPSLSNMVYDDYEPGQMADYYDEAFPSDVEPLSEQIRQAEMESHGSPFSSHGQAPVPHSKVQHAPGGTTKAAGPKQGSGAVLPAYCDPPNPCPIGYTAKDGCLESFENTSEFSRSYQARQNCLCDSEHMFNCPMEEQDQPRAQHEPFLAGMPPSLTSELEPENPFLAGHKLPVAAKKGLGY